MSDFIDTDSPENPFKAAPAKANFVDSASPENPFKPQDSPSLMSVITHGIQALRSGEPTPENKQAAERLTEIPRNGLRGAAVGVENAIEGKSLSDSMNRADAATKPGYVAPDGEKLADFAANASDPRFLPIAELKLLKGAGLVSKAVNGAVQGAVGGAGASALDSASKKEDLNPAEMANNAKFGAAIAGPLAPIIHGVAELPETSDKVAKIAFNTYRRFAGADPVAANAAYDNLEKVMAAKGTQESIQAATDKLRSIVSDAKSTPGQAYEALRSDLTPKMSPDEERAFELSKPQGYDQPKNVLHRLDNVLSQPVPADAPPEIQKQYAGDLLKARDEVKQFAKFNPQERLNVGVNPDQAFWDGQYALINSKLDQLPVAGPFRQADAAYHEGATAFDALKNKFATRGSATAAAQDLALAKPLSAPEARSVDVTDALKQVPGAESALEDAKNEIYRRALENPTSMIDRNAHKGFMSDLLLPWMKQATIAAKGAGKAAKAAFAIPAFAGQVADTDAARGLVIGAAREAAEKEKKDK